VASTKQTISDTFVNKIFLPKCHIRLIIHYMAELTKQSRLFKPLYRRLCIKLDITRLQCVNSALYPLWTASNCLSNAVKVRTGCKDCFFYRNLLHGSIWKIWNCVIAINWKDYSKSLIHTKNYIILRYRYRKHDVSETGSVSVIMWGGKTGTQLGPLEKKHPLETLKNLRYRLKKLWGFSPLANYTDRATAACRRS
jgi:hypothetical protein